MPNFRRRYVRGGTYFFTAVTDGRQPILTIDASRTFLHEAIRQTRDRWPFEIDAWVLLPDHLHTMWTLPPGDADYSRRWAFLKKVFTKAYLAAGGAEATRTIGRVRDGRWGVWQPKFWEHTIRDDEDYARHFHYLHYNPVKHGLTARVVDYPHSTFHRHVRGGTYPTTWPDWAAGTPDHLFRGIDVAAIEVGE
jgi:putative transposase